MMSFKSWRLGVMPKRMLALTGCLLVMFFGTNNFCHAQTPAGASKDENLAAAQIEDVRIKAQGLAQVLGRLSLSYDIPIGFEVAVNVDELAIYDLYFKRGTLRELLTQFVARH